MRYVFGDYTLDTMQYEVRHTGTPIALRPKVFHLLTYLLVHRDRIVPRQELCEHLWPKQFVSDATFDSCLAQARQAVGDSGRTQRVIQTRHGHGYRFVAAVEVQDQRVGETDRRSTPVSPDASAGVEPAQTQTGTAGAQVLVPDEVREPPVPLTPRYPPPRPLLMGERKVVTVLVCTLVDAAALAQRLEAEALHQRMQAFFTRALAEVERYGGTLQRVLDDGALLLFGAPVAHEDHAECAVLAALRLQQALHGSTPDPACPSETWEVRMGLHTGQLIIGPLGDDGRLTFTAVGDTIRLATWLAQQGAPDRILISEATARLVRDAVRLETSPLMPGPEQSHTGKAYKVLGLGPRRAPLLRHARRPLSPFVGRQLELATLRALLRRVEAGQGQVVSLVGEPGMGKTRLVYEFWHSLESTRVMSLEGRCDAHGQATPYLPLQAIVRQVCGINDGESPTTITAHMHHYLQELGMTAAEDAPYLLHVLGVPDAAARLAGVNPQTIRIRTFSVLHQLLLRQRQRQPLLVVVENLHWIDPTSQEYLAELAERLAGVPLLLLVTCRPGYRPPWMDKSYATQLTLSQLSSEDSQQVVQAVLPAMPLSERLLKEILEKAGGNPLFLEELAWAMREQGDLRLPSEIPTTVQAILATRIDRLPPEAKRLLQTAAVIGPEVPWRLLQALAGMAEDELRHALQRLQAAEFLYETRLAPEGTYTFKHALTREVAYNGLLQEHRRALHARIVEAMEGRAGDRLAEPVERLAHHALRGEVWDKALVYCRQAGETATARSAYREAVAAFEQALSALAHLPETHDTRAQAIDLRLDLVSALSSLGDFGRILALLREAEALAEALDDPSQLGQISARLSVHFRQMGAYDQAITAGERALTHAVAGRDIALQALANQCLGLAYARRGNYRRAIDCYRQTVEFFDGARRREHFAQVIPPRVRSRVALATCYAQLGMFAEGKAVGDEGLRMAEAMAHPASLMYASWGIGFLALCQGDLHGALPRLERAIGLCEDADLPIYFHQIAAPLGAAYALAGRVADAVALLTQAIEQATAMEMVVFQVSCRLSLGEAHLLAGHLEEAHGLAERALVLAREHQERGDEVRALHLLGEIAARRKLPDSESAETYYRQALTLAEALGMRPLQAHCHLGLGTLYVKTGQPEQARAELSTAIELYRAMDMTFRLPQAEAGLTQVRSSLALPKHR